MVEFLMWFSQILLLVLGVFLIIIVLLQRGRGGGLAGAFGGMGGQSAFGSKAGDVFTRITIVLAVLWVVVSGGSGFFLRAAAEQQGKSQLPDEVQLDETTDSDGADGPVIPPQPPQPPEDSTTTPESTGETGDAGASGSEDVPATDGAGADEPTDSNPGDETSGDATPAEQN
jgi:preprotein translocase subunit SecG